MEKKVLNAQAAKKEFVKSIHNWLMKTLDRLDRSDYKECFELGENEIMCHIPSNYFDLYEIPEGLKIEMKFTVKKN